MIHKVWFDLNEYMHIIFIYSFNNNLCIYLSQFMYIVFCCCFLYYFCIIFTEGNFKSIASVSLCVKVIWNTRYLAPLSICTLTYFKKLRIGTNVVISFKLKNNVQNVKPLTAFSTKITIFHKKYMYQTELGKLTNH